MQFPGTPDTSSLLLLGVCSGAKIGDVLRVRDLPVVTKPSEGEAPSLLPPSTPRAAGFCPQPRPLPLTHLPASKDVAGQLDFWQVAFPDGPQQAVVAYVGLLLGTGGDGVPAAGAQGRRWTRMGPCLRTATAQGTMLVGETEREWRAAPRPTRQSA